MRSAAVVIPVRDGACWLEEVLAAVAAEHPDELLVIDSGSRDGSAEIAREAGARVLGIAPEDFGHGRTRNLGAEATEAELICFLTQDATPLPGWLAALREAFDLAPQIGAAYGPHLPRPDTSPMIARELEEFFAGFSPDGRPVVQDAADPAFLSNVNAAYLRACWAEIRFRDVPYAEDQAFGRDLLAAGWRKAYHPGARVLHAHDYGWTGFMRRYFDEFRGLRETVGHVERFSPRGSAGHVARQVRGDRAWLRARGEPAGPAALARSALHHGGRKAAAALGSRADRLPAPVRGAISLERRGDAPAARGGPKLTRVAPPVRRTPFGSILEVERDGPAPLREPVPGAADRPKLHIAVAFPPFRRGSGGHGTLFQLVAGLERMGHTVSLWLEDPLGDQDEWPAAVRRRICEEFSPVAAPVFRGWEDWYGADVALATGWQTVHPVLALPGCGARAYLVQDHEPEFFPTSIERGWAERTYEHDLFCVCASPWLLSLMRERYGRDGSVFRLSVDHGVYRPRPIARREDTVVFYVRAGTPRRAGPLGMLALAELHRRRPDVRIVLFGDAIAPPATFPVDVAGVATPAELSWLYSEATVGLCLSLTNYSLVTQEMLACGLPCVDLAGIANEGVFGADGPVGLVDPDPVAIAGALDALLGDPAERRRRSAAGLELVFELSWQGAAEQVESGLRDALRARERAGARPST